MGKVLEYLKKDRGGTNFNKIFSKIPKKFYENAGFTLVLIMMASLIVEEVLQIFFRGSVYIRLFYLFGAVGIIFAIMYIISIFVEQKKNIERMEYDSKKKVKKYVDKETGKVKVKESENTVPIPKMKDLLKGHIWDLALVAMLLWSCISTLMADDREMALTGVFLRHDGLDSYFIYAGMYVCAKTVKSEKKRIWMLRAMMITISLLSVMTIFQVNDSVIESLGNIGDNMIRHKKYSSIYINRNHFGYVLTIGLMAMAALVIIEKKIVAKVIALILFMFNLWALILNDTFGSYLGVLFGIVFLSVIMLVRDKKQYKEVICVVLAFLAVSIFVNMDNNILSTNFNITYHDSKTISTNDNGGSGRIRLWKATIECIKERPIFGFGPEGLRERFLGTELGNDRPHNEYLQHAAFLGIPGLLFYLIALITLFVFCIRNIKEIPLVLVAVGGIVFGYCVSAFFGNTLYYTTPYYFMFLGLLSSCNNAKKIDKETNKL